jgi:hypothetical protein
VTVAGLMLVLAIQGSDAAAASAAVQRFYETVIKDHPLGVPEGATKKALWPLLSTRLAAQLELLQSCEDDYYRRNRARLNPEPRRGDPNPPAYLKPTIAWLEQGLFSGHNEQALPAELAVVAAEPSVSGSMQVRVRFIYRDTFETYGRPPTDANTFEWPGIVVVVRENDRYLIDDFLPIDEQSGKTMTPLSAGFRECRGATWVGLKGQRY